MLVKKIHLRNFRLIENSTLTPSKDGITGLVGVNGAGKSSFLIALRWALFGARPAGESNAKLIRQASLDEDDFECFVEVEIEHDNSTLRVLRKMSKKGTASAKVWIDGEQVSVDSATSANAAITRFLGAQEAVFSIRHIIGQNELNSLLDARPANRKSLIEESVGVNILSNSIDSARKELSNTPAGADYSDVIESLMGEKSLNESYLREVESSLLSIGDDGSHSDTLRKRIGEMDSAMSARRIAIERSDDLRKQIAQLPQGEIVDVPDVVDIDTSFAERIAVAERAEAERRSVEEKISSLPSELIDASELENRIAKGVEYVGARSALVSSIEQEIRERSKFTANDIASECALCGSDIHDVERARQLFEEKNASLNERLGVAELEKLRGEKLLEELRAQLSSVNAHNALVGERDGLLQRLMELPPVEDIQALRSAQSENRRAVSESQKARQEAIEHNSLIERRISLEENLQSIVIPDEINIAEYEKITQELNKATENEKKIIELNTKINIYTESIKNAESRISELEHKQEQSKEINEKRSILEGSVQTLRDYRESILATLGPDMEEKMSELINTMTKGEYVSARVDDDFNVFVTSSANEERPITSLSGGERAIVSLAMRMSLSGTDSGLLWMDEVSSALDSERLEAFMSGLHELGRQIIVVDHRETASSHYDSIVRFERGTYSSKII